MTQTNTQPEAPVRAGTRHVTREYSNQLLEMIEEGILDRDTVIMAFVKYLSEDQVRDMMHHNEMIPEPKDLFEGFDSDTYDVEAMRMDHGNGNFDPEDDDPERYEHTAIVAASITNGQFAQAKEQCLRYGLDWSVEKPEGVQL